jgi:deoxyribodipyrimidine photo-lyase
MTGNHEMYKVFTPFKNAWLKRIKDGIPECVSAPKMRDSGALSVVKRNNAELSAAIF